MQMDNHEDLTQVNRVVCFALAVGTAIIFERFVYPYDANALAIALIWATSCLAGGALVGFLFGIPRVLQSGDAIQPNGQESGPAAASSRSTEKSAKAAAYRQQVNTNLVEISDWLTKIIVGLGLINLKDVPGLLDSAATTLAHGLAGQSSCASGAPCPDYAFAIGIIVSFSIFGFPMGYLYTRLFLAGAFWRADSDPEKELRSATERIINEEKAITASDGRGQVTAAQVKAAERVSGLSEAENLNSTIETLRTLAREYEHVRSTMLSGNRRTARMEKVVTTMRALALAGYDALPQFADNASAGDRLVAIAMLQVRPNATYLRWLRDRVVQEKPFVSYHALEALRRAAEALDATGSQSIKTLLEEWLASTPDPEPFKDDPDRAVLLKDVLKMVGVERA